MLRAYELLRASVSPRLGPIAVMGILRRVVVPVVAVVAWQLLVSEMHFGQGFVPTPVAVAREWWAWIFGGGSLSDPYAGTWLMAAEASTQRVVLGFAVAALVGIPLGILIGRFVLAADLFDPLIQVLRPIPISAWIPFAIVLFGINPSSAVFLIALGSFFPVVINTTDGARRVSPLHIQAAQMLGTSQARLLVRVILPAALPSIMVGLRLAIGLAWVLVVIAELVAVKSGFGYVLWDAYYQTRMTMVVAAMGSVGFLGFLSDRLIIALSRYLLRWQDRR